MIAVLADDGERLIASEFFELFKTPWQFYREGCSHDVLLCARDQFRPSSARLVVVYGAEPGSLEKETKIAVRSQGSNGVLSYKGDRIPVYGDCLTFPGAEGHPLAHERTGEPAAWQFTSPGQTLVRVGFDLFPEIRHLLTHGQSLVHARIPALELHIGLLRDLILGCAIPLVEIPPVPAGHNFVVCLTHDVDHPGIRNHKCDHTMFGFLHRALFGSLINFCRGRQSLASVAANWRAVLSLPFVYLGLARDFWSPFDRYLEIEKGLASTFFLIPKKGDPGRNANDLAPSRRAARYDLAEISDQIHTLISERREIGVHGIDAWRDEEEGRAERKTISQVNGASDLGVRMHWLYFDEQSPGILERAGFSYDSTVGYNEAVGYRAGTGQVFKPFGLEKLLELPLHIMDTALFYPAYMDLSPGEARAEVDGLIENASRFGGVLTVNWHDRSIAPERLWGEFYVGLLENLTRKGPWFATAAEAVSWFRKRRSAAFESPTLQSASSRPKISLKQTNDSLPGLRLRVHHVSAQPNSGNKQTKYHTNFVDVEFNDSTELETAGAEALTSLPLT